jgi:hypothetical protein
MILGISRRFTSRNDMGIIYLLTTSNKKRRVAGTPRKIFAPVLLCVVALKLIPLMWF